MHCLTVLLWYCVTVVLCYCYHWPCLGGPCCIYLPVICKFKIKFLLHISGCNTTRFCYTFSIWTLEEMHYCCNINYGWLRWMTNRCCSQGWLCTNWAHYFTGNGFRKNPSWIPFGAHYWHSRLVEGLAGLLGKWNATLISQTRMSEKQDASLLHSWTKAAVKATISFLLLIYVAMTVRQMSWCWV